MVQKNWFILVAALAGGLVGAATVSSLTHRSNKTQDLLLLDWLPQREI